jgi:hypothetical protein
MHHVSKESNKIHEAGEARSNVRTQGVENIFSQKQNSLKQRSHGQQK